MSLFDSSKPLGTPALSHPSSASSAGPLAVDRCSDAGHPWISRICTARRKSESEPARRPATSQPGERWHFDGPGVIEQFPAGQPAFSITQRQARSPSVEEIKERGRTPASSSPCMSIAFRNDRQPDANVSAEVLFPCRKAEDSGQIRTVGTAPQMSAKSVVCPSGGARRSRYGPTS